ncbi:MAG: translational GTPase TypA [Alphaproteobacteria bacterium]
MSFEKSLRNLAIIAHVDHGKTTLVDALLRQSGTFQDHQQVSERIMDSNDLEKERGITILAKCTSILWQGHRLNIVDTPGHADFGGEVERILSMVDGVLLLVDSAEGVMPQTKFVLAKALKRGLKPIVIVNKIDRPDARSEDVHLEVLELFSLLDASPEQMDFPVLYASGRQGWAVKELGDAQENLTPLFEEMVRSIPEVQGNKEAPLRVLVSLLEVNPYLGRILIGRVAEGTLKVNQTLKALSLDGKTVEQARVTKLMRFQGIEKVAVEEVRTGDIIAIAGFEKASVTHTLCAPDVTEPLETLPIDPPTLSIVFAVNDSPFAGKEGSKVTSRAIRDRLLQEAEGNVAIQVTETAEKDAFDVAGRGELQLGILIETMRREGFELSIMRPRVLYQKDPETGKNLEPLEELQVDVDEPYTGIVIEKLSLRRGEMVEMKPSGGGKVRLSFIIPSRGLIGYQGEFLTDTRGSGVMSRLFHGYAPHRGPIEERRNGVLISNSTGVAADYALFNLEERGVLFIGGNVPVYEGMIIGEHSRENDLEVNPLKAKQLTNFRAAGKDEAVRLTPPRLMTLEQAITYIQGDESVEITPKSIRLRKILLNPHDRKKAGRSGRTD